MSEQTPVGTTASSDITPEELRLAARNHAFPLEALRYDVTPVGLHYLLIHYDIPTVEAHAWQLRVEGRVRQPLRLSLADLQARPARTLPVTMECAGNGRALLHPRPLSQPWLHEAVGNAEWTGTPLADLLEEAGVDGDAVEVVFTGLDRGVEGGVEQTYARSLPLADALDHDVLIAYAVNGRPLPPQHGFPARLIVPGWYGMASVKWLASIAIVHEPFTGYQQSRSYRMREVPEDDGVPVSRIAVRSLMVPPGVPDFATRHRLAEPGDHTVEGRAWSGHGAIERVELSTDGGSTWGPADLEPPDGPHAWQRWRTTWTAPVGEHVLCCRATDAAGNTQPLEPPWNLGGYANNAVQRVPVTVRED